MKLKHLILALGWLAVPATQAIPPTAPPGYQWATNSTFTDEFNGTSLDLGKWYDYHPWWAGRPPAKFVPSTISVTNGLLQIRNDVLNPPQGSFTIAGGAVVSRTTTAHYGYYEARMKASKISMSSTFWMSNQGQQINGITSSQELDITETIGAPNPQPTWAANWNKRMNSNTHYKYSGPGPATNHSVGDNAVISPPSPPTGDDFHVYGAWWVDANTIHFYHNDQWVYTIHPSTNVVAQPFDRPMHINLVTETYDWEAPPATEDLTNNAINTTYYDWVRAYFLEIPGTQPPVPSVVWQDAEPQSAASTIHDGITMSPGSPDPAGGTETVSRCYYPNPTHTEYRNLGVNGGNSGFIIPGSATEVQAPLGGGYQYANIDSNYLGRPFQFSAEVYVPATSPLGADANDSLGIFIRWQNSSGGTVVQGTQASANLNLPNVWQPLLLTGTSPTDNNIARVAPLLATRDNATNAEEDETLYYLRNVSFQVAGGLLAPTLQFTRQGEDLVLSWTSPGFKLQSQTVPASSGIGTNWINYPLPAGTNPPVTIPLDAWNDMVLFRLAPE